MKIISFLDKRLEEFLIASFIGYFTVASVLQVLFRFVFQIPAAWTEETARYAFIWMMFVGAAAAVKKGSHISVDLLDSFLKNPSVKKKLNLVCKLMFLIFCLATTYVGTKICISAAGTTQRSPVLEISYFWVYLSMPVGMGLASFRLIQSFFVKASKDNEGEGGADV